MNYIQPTNLLTIYNTNNFIKPNDFLTNNNSIFLSKNINFNDISLNNDLIIKNKLTLDYVNSSRLAILDNSKNIVSGTPTTTELSYIQTLNNNFTSIYGNKLTIYDNVTGNPIANVKILYGKGTTVASGASRIITFTQTFNTTPSVFASGTRTDERPRALLINTITTTSFTIEGWQPNGTLSSTSFDWIAIGS
jgi:hypothetical protein